METLGSVLLGLGRSEKDTPNGAATSERRRGAAMPPRGFSIATLCVAMVLTMAIPAFADGDDLVIEGSGWGHGIGMSQYGAYGRALAGHDADDIIEAYYTGAAVGSLGAGGVPAAPDVMVNVASDQVSNVVRIIYQQAGGVDGVEMSRPGDTPVVLTPAQNDDLRVRITDNLPSGDGGCLVEVSPDGDPDNYAPEWGGVEGSCDITFPLYGDGPPGNLIRLEDCRDPDPKDCTFGLGEYLLLIDNYSPLRTTPDSGWDGFDSVIKMNPEQYMMGINEVPWSWGIQGDAALEAQVIAARSYGIGAVLARNHLTRGCFCDVVSSTVDQNYDGWPGQTNESHVPGTYYDEWADAVVATAGEIVEHDDATNDIVTAYYSSANGGRSMNNEDYWGGSPISWLRSVDDPYTLNPSSGNPNIEWGPPAPVVSKAALAGILGLQLIYDVEILDTYDSGSPSRIAVTGRDATGTVVKDTYGGSYIDGVTFKNWFGLKSAYITGFGGDLPGPPPATDTERWAGANRYKTAIEVSQANYPAGAETVIIATGLNFPDALAAASLAEGAGAPVLLVAGGSVPGSVLAEVNRLNPSEIVILGGTAAVPMSAEDVLDDVAPVTRLAGSNRYETAIKIAEATHPGTSDVVFVAPGTTYPEPLVAGSAAAADDAPVLLVPPTSLPGSVATELVRLNPTTVVVVGGGTVISQAVVDAIAGLGPTVQTIAGPNRYTMSANVSAYAFPGGADFVLVATGNNFPDALAGSGVAGLLDAPILLVGSTLPSVIAAELQRLDPDTVRVLGGPAAVPPAVYDAIVDLLD